MSNPFERGKPWYDILRMAHGAEEVTLAPLLMKDCANCVHTRFPHDGLHCYMFRDEPPGDRCGQFRDARK